MAFWGTVLKPNKTVSVESPEGDILHLSQACLNEPKDGKNYVMASVNGASYAIACLEKGKKEHDSFDLFFDPKACSFLNKGQSDVHLTGYFEPAEDGEDDEEEAAPPTKAPSPKVVAGKVASPKVETKSSPKAAAAASPKKEAPKAVAAGAAESDSDEEEGEEEELMEDEEEEEEDASAAPPIQQGKRKPEAAAAPPVQQGKRKPEAAASGSPAKKGKAEPANPLDAYVKTVHAYLKANGKQSFSEVAGKCPKPKEAPKKFKALFAQHQDKFDVVGDVVSAK